MGNRVAGVCYVKVDGAQLEVKGGLECPINNRKREAIVASAGVAGFKETTVVPYVKLTAIFTADFPKEKISAATDMTITAEYANGEVYTLSDAFLANESAAKGEEGEIELEFNGMRGRWQ
ncbi:phage tail tube protein [Variovorax sp. RCC_210]|uniref:phage tail tube protein n=1 Tax=Variovorax sp. RCC_210 TaxID=3239217 RepID=UPI003525FD9C